jgi:hypothetical protein
MKKITPQNAKSQKDLEKLSRDNWSYRTYWMLVGENEVTIAKQKKLQKCESMTSIPKSIFNKMIKDYVGK